MKDWNAEPYVTGQQWAEMLPYQQEWFRRQPDIWRSDPRCDVLWNMAHPDNRMRAIESLLAEVMA